MATSMVKTNFGLTGSNYVKPNSRDSSSAESAFLASCSRCFASSASRARSRSSAPGSPTTRPHSAHWRPGRHPPPPYAVGPPGPHAEPPDPVRAPGLASVTPTTTWGRRSAYQERSMLLKQQRSEGPAKQGPVRCRAFAKYNLLALLPHTDA